MFLSPIDSAIKISAIRISATKAAAKTFAVFVLCLGTGLAQDAKQLAAQDYADAEKFMPYNVNPLAYQGQVHAKWLEDGRFWYRDADATGVSYVVVDPAKGTRGAAFDQEKLAAALHASNAAIKDDARHLKLSDLSITDGDSVVSFTHSGVPYRCDLRAKSEACKSLIPVAAASAPHAHADKHPPLAISPNKKLGAFVRDWNLWVRNIETGAETQVTTDGVKDYGYATENAGWIHSDDAVVLWSPDSTKIATFQQDQRKTGEMYLVPISNTHAPLSAWKYPLVGDADVTMIERVVIDVNSHKVTRLKMAPRSAPIDAVRRLVLPWRLGRCRMESRWRPPGIRLNLARPQAGMAASRRYIHRSGARGDGRIDR